MTEKSQVTNPIAASQAIDGTYSPTVYSEEAVEALKLSPYKTVWGFDFGRPVYDRLPAIEEGYKVAYDRDQPRVYINPEANRAIGVNTIEVKRDQRKFAQLNIQGGQITWKEGMVKVDPVEVDTNEFNQGYGLPVGTYQVVYRIIPARELDDSPIPQHVEVKVENSTISDAYLDFKASSETSAHLDYYAIDTVETTNAWWPSVNAETGGYDTGADFTLDFGAEVRPEGLTVHGDNVKLADAKCALYGSDEGILWFLEDEQESVDGTWFLSNSFHRRRYLRTFFWDGHASIITFDYTGTLYYQDRRVREKQYVAVLVVKDMFEEVKGDYLTLATFEIQQLGVIKNLRDLRQVTYVKYEPVASWLTQFHDDNLRCLFDVVTNYNRTSMTPMSAAKYMYAELEDTTCFGLSEFDLGKTFGKRRAVLPYMLNIDEGNITPRNIDLLADPTDDSSLTNKAYADYQLYESWSLDNGIY